MTIKKISAGKYQVIYHGFVFNVFDETECWILWNTRGTEIFRFDTKKACLEALSSYSKQGAEELHNQEFCNK